MTEFTRLQLESLAYCGHAWEKETSLGITRSHRQMAPSFTEYCAECMDRYKSHMAAFEIGQSNTKEN